ncbi:MAG TPA: M56 family metallopeptidase [Pyrinomonadaceae bacterium]|nr:M56 family metallopeptidase [Pyrinomonadaceae bacterium]
MNAFETLLENPFVQTLGWTLLHFLWQGALVAILFANLQAVLRRRSANLRYALSCAAMLLMLALPITTFCVLSLNAETGAQTMPATQTTVEEVASRPTDTAVNPTTDSYAATARRTEDASLIPTVWRRGEMARRLQGLLPWAVGTWVLGVLLLSLRMAGGWAFAQRLKRKQTTLAPEEWQERLRDLCVRLRVTRPVRLCQSLLVEVPTVIGWLEPVVLVPVRALTGMTPEQLEALLAHELAHIRRHDYLVNLFQTAVETLLFYHPAVWWVSHQMRVERENCCDDAAVAACGDVLVYARALTELEQLRMGYDAPAMAVAASGGSLVERIGRLVKMPAPRSQRSSPLLAGFIAAATLLCVWAGTRPGVSAHASAAALGSIAQQPSADESATQDETLRDAQSPQRADEKPEADEEEEAQKNQDEEEEELDVSGIEDEAEAMSEEAEELAEAEVPAEPGEQDKDEEEKQARDAAAPRGDYIDELAAEGYTNLSVNQLIDLRVHGVSADYIRRMRALGFDKLPVNKLVALKIHGVSAETVESMRSAGFDKLSPDQLLSVRIHGLSPAYVREMRSRLGSGLTFNQLLALKIHGVNPDYIESMKSAGFGNVSADRLTSAKIHGVTPEFARAMAATGYPNLSLDKLIGLRIHGVTPEFVRTVRARGFDDLTVEQLMHLKRLGIIKPTN